MIVITTFYWGWFNFNKNVKHLRNTRTTKTKWLYFRTAVTLMKRFCKENPVERIGYQKDGVHDIKKHRWFQVRQKFLLWNSLPQWCWMLMREYQLYQLFKFHLQKAALAHLFSHEVWCHDIDTLYSALTQFVSDDDNSERSCHGDLTWSPITYQKLSIILKICQYCTGRLISSSSEMGLYQFYPGTALDSLWSPRHKLAPLNIYCRHNFQASVLPTVTYPGQGGLGWLNLASFMSITSPDIDYPNISTVLESHTEKVKCIQISILSLHDFLILRLVSIIIPTEKKWE